MGRILTKEDIAYYQKIVVAIRETIRIMDEIDKVIEEHGGLTKNEIPAGPVLGKVGGS